jgi:hypothetical protein
MLMDKQLVLGVAVVIVVVVVVAAITTYHDQYQILRHSRYQIMLFPLLGQIIARTGTAYAMRYNLYY